MVKETFSFPQPICEINWCQFMNSLRFTPKGQLLDSEWDIIFCTKLYLYLTNLVIRPKTQSFPQSCFELSTETDLTNLVIVAFLLWILQKPILLFFLRNQLLIFSDAERLVQEDVTWNGILQTRKALFPWITRFE